MSIGTGLWRSRAVTIAAVAFSLVTAIAVFAQKDNKTWLELPRKDADRLLANSPWSQTQVDTDVSEMFFSPTRPGAASTGRATTRNTTDQQSRNNNRADRGAVNEVVKVTYRIAFLSARPIRQAFARMILSQNERDEKLLARLQAFVERDFSPYVVIAVHVDATDNRFLGPVMQEIKSATTGTLKNSAYLERQDGKRLFLSEYLPPISDGLGAKFIFPRLVDGQPFLNSDSGTVRFFAEFNPSFKLNMQYKVADMFFDQKLEY